jgi:hypothetical protein
MSLLFIEGFDHYGTTGPHTVGYQGKWVSGSTSGVSNPGRTGPGCLRFSVDTIVSKPLAVVGNGGVIGVAIYLTSYQGYDVCAFRENTITHMSIRIEGDGRFSVWRGSTQLAVSTKLLAQNSWYYLEFKAVIDDVTGSYEVRVDGVPEATLTTPGPVDTRNGGTGQWDRIALSYYTGFMDDIYVVDLNGAPPRNNFLGPCKVETLFPQTDAVAVGTHQGLTPVGTADHGNNVDEQNPSTADYNYSATVGVKDTYNFPSLSLSGTIYGIQTNLLVSKSDSANRQVCAVVRTAGIDADGANVSPLTTYSYMSEIRQLDPNAGSPIEWTSGAVAGMEAGMKITI